MPDPITVAPVLFTGQTIEARELCAALKRVGQDAAIVKLHRLRCDNMTDAQIVDRYGIDGADQQEKLANAGEFRTRLQDAEPLTSSVELAKLLLIL